MRLNYPFEPWITVDITIDLRELVDCPFLDDCWEYPDICEGVSVLQLTGSEASDFADMFRKCSVISSSSTPHKTSNFQYVFNSKHNRLIHQRYWFLVTLASPGTSIPRGRYFLFHSNNQNGFISLYSNYLILIDFRSFKKV